MKLAIGCDEAAYALKVEIMNLERRKEKLCCIRMLR